MARIFKGTEGTILLHFKHFLDYTPDIHTVVLYTTDVENVVRIYTDIRCDDSFVEVVVKPTDFDNMEDGVINYILEGSDVRVERQSNNYLKTPISNPTTGIQLRKEETLSENGDYTINPDHGYKGMGEVNIHVNVDVETPYNQGFEEGNIIGYETGMRVQKELLETLTVTENGTYTKEDGYNEIIVDVPDLNGDYQTGFDEGYSQGNQAGYDTGYMEGETAGYDSGLEIGKEIGVNQAGEIIAETAQVLNITENGEYRTQYSEPILITPITGKYNDGSNFFDYAYISKRGYNTGIYPSPTTKIEFWWRFDGVVEGTGLGEGVIIGAHKWGQAASIFKIGFSMYNEKMVASIGNSSFNFDITYNNWHHIIIDYADGLIIDGEKIADFGNGNLTETSIYDPICINGYYSNNRINADDFGIVKITDNGIETIFIPTADGFLNTTTNELLPIVNDIDGEYIYNQVEPEYDKPTGNLIKTINVNIQPKIKLATSGIKFSYSTFSKVPDYFDFTGLENSTYLFNQCRNLLEIPDLSVCKFKGSMEKAFSDAVKLESIPWFDSSEVTSFYYTFNSCNSIKTIPELDTSNITNFQNCFYACGNLISLPPLNCSKAINMSDFFSYSFNNVAGEKITDVGGFIGLKCKWTGGGLNKCPNLTYQSCINVLNGLYDFTGNGETPTSSQGQLQVHQNFLTTVGDEISIGVQKGWIIQS